MLEIFGTEHQLKKTTPDCHLETHHRLGWCGNCPGVSLSTEALGWRIIARDRLAMPDLSWAREKTKEMKTS